ncbi:hypothetical protein WBP07_29490 [Novosphingobium sp. BL-8A]
MTIRIAQLAIRHGRNEAALDQIIVFAIARRQRLREGAETLTRHGAGRFSGVRRSPNFGGGTGRGFLRHGRHCQQSKNGG